VPGQKIEYKWTNGQISYVPAPELKWTAGWLALGLRKSPRTVQITYREIRSTMKTTIVEHRRLGLRSDPAFGIGPTTLETSIRSL